MSSMPAIPYTWISQFQFYVEDGVTKIAFGEAGKFFVAVALSNASAADLVAKLGGVVGAPPKSALPGLPASVVSPKPETGSL